MNNRLTNKEFFPNILAKYLVWIFINTLGFGLVLPAMFITTIALVPILIIMDNLKIGVGLDPLMIILPAIQTITLVIVIGLCQWTILGYHRISLPLWLIVNFIGWFVPLGFFIFGYIKYFPTGNLWRDLLLSGFGVGSLIGFTQWLLMRKVNKRSLWWIPANILGYISGFAIIGLVYISVSNLGDDLLTGFSLYILVPILGVVTSIISGIALLWPINWFDSLNATQPRLDANSN